LRLPNVRHKPLFKLHAEAFCRAKTAEASVAVLDAERGRALAYERVYEVEREAMSTTSASSAAAMRLTASNTLSALQHAIDGGGK
jgi:hypothetical protein